MTQPTQLWVDDPTREISAVVTEPDPPGDEFLSDDDFLPATQGRTSRLTLLLAVALILTIGFVLGVQAQKLFGT